jgi:hypothetical protein
MSGKRYLLDTNAIIALLQGNNLLVQQLQDAEWVGISIISQIEFMAFSGLSEQDLQCFKQFLQRVDVVGLESNQTELIDLIIQIRQQYRLKLPDAMIVATAIQCHARLVTTDSQLKNLANVNIFDFT